MPTTVGTLTFISRVNTKSESLKARVEHGKSFITSGPGIRLFRVVMVAVIFPSFCFYFSGYTCIFSIFQDYLLTDILHRVRGERTDYIKTAFLISKTAFYITKQRFRSQI